MTFFRLVLPTRNTSYTGKAESIPEKSAFDSSFRLILPTQKSSYAGKAEAEPPIGGGQTLNVMKDIMQNIMADTINDGGCC